MINWGSDPNHSVSILENSTNCGSGSLIGISGPLIGVGDPWKGIIGTNIGIGGCSFD